MPQYMFIYRDPKEQHEADMSPDQMQKIMESWHAWIGQGMEAGWMATAGDALQPNGRVIGSDKVVSDGPFAESKEIVGGYSVVQADNYEMACEYAKSCPALNSPKGTVEVREIAVFE